MARYNQKKSVTSSLVIAIVFILALFALLAFLSTYTNGFTKDFQTFYVEHNGEKIVADANGVELEMKKASRFDVRGSLDITNSATIDYTVTVVPNATKETDFLFTAGDNTYSYSKVTDLTRAFVIETYDGYFTVMADKPLSEMLSLLFLGETIENAPQVINAELDYFTLVVALADGTEAIKINFSLLQRKMILSEENWVF